MNFTTVLSNHTKLLSYVTKAMELASKVHKHQTRSFANEPYINHCIRVANNPQVVNQGALAICVALMHDCMEDAEYPEEITKYIQENFPQEVFDACKLLTHNRMEYTYQEYIQNILDSKNRYAIIVKYADSLDNSTPTSSMPEEWIGKCKLYKARSDQYLSYFNEVFNES